jgi:hypothetical protein
VGTSRQTVTGAIEAARMRNSAPLRPMGGSLPAVASDLSGPSALPDFALPVYRCGNLLTGPDDLDLSTFDDQELI